ncbi:4-hydroxy-2-oxovalerate aldolase [Parageobacillus thermoglucosidasius]|uniref:4-hydroxy-2-oxovalerate aldolase n=1 Tax=Parageobacillus thermoglucosidasius TaxID=1426 RepID=UPI000E18213B|nr:4-hydroxy-2-oxovalerate aldolase [Parageobacillus thermoglucosidasius]RDE31151.1 4-hydroxy-2-oxovalerate aldolase [Parageobacillus thermoglucosidasius]
MKFPRLTDTTLRDGSHAVSHRFTPEQIRIVVHKLDEAGIPVIEVSHGAGLHGSTIQQGFSAYPEFELLAEALNTVKQAKIASLFVPGIGTSIELKQAAEMGIDVIRIAVHCTEADISQQHFELAKQLSLEAVGFLMMAHTQPPSVLVKQAKLMESYGADCVYVVDSAGSMLPSDAEERVQALKDALSIEVGFHAHNNLGLAIGNTIAAMKAGADQIDGTLRGLGAGAGNAPTEVLVAVLKKMGFDTGLNLSILMDLAEDVIAPMLPYPIVIDRDNLSSGYAGVYNSFLLHVRHAAEKFGVNASDIVEELGKRQAIAGQEDWILDVAVKLAERK